MDNDVGQRTRAAIAYSMHTSSSPLCPELLKHPEEEDSLEGQVVTESVLSREVSPQFSFFLCVAMCFIY